MSASVASSGFLVPEGGALHSATDSPDDVDSLPESGATSSTGDEYDPDDAERQWRESLQQIELLFTLFFIPYLGKYLGRRAAFWGWAKFMEWKHPSSEVVFTSKGSFRAVGAFEAAAL